MEQSKLTMQTETYLWKFIVQTFGTGIYSKTKNYAKSDQTRPYIESNSKPSKPLKGGKMNIKKLIILMVATGAISACGGGDDGPSSKPFFSKWTSSSMEIDFTGGQFYINYNLTYYVSANAGCNCQIRAEGDDLTGMIYIHACSNFGPGPNMCPAGTDGYTYSNQNAQLTVCDQLNSPCEVYL